MERLCGHSPLYAFSFSHRGCPLLPSFPSLKPAFFGAHSYYSILSLEPCSFSPRCGFCPLTSSARLVGGSTSLKFVNSLRKTAAFSRMALIESVVRTGNTVYFVPPSQKRGLNKQKFVLDPLQRPSLPASTTQLLFLPSAQAIYAK